MLLDQGLSRNGIVRRAAVSGATMSKVCTEEGRAFDRSKTALAGCKPVPFRRSSAAATMVEP